MAKDVNEARLRMLRKATKVVKLYPFIYTVIFILCMVVYYTASEKSAQIVDRLFTVTPIMILPFILLSRTFKLCNWHRLQCVLPIFPQVASFVSIFVDLTFAAVFVNISVSVLVCFLTLFNAYFVFIRKPKRNE